LRGFSPDRDNPLPESRSDTLAAGREELVEEFFHDAMENRGPVLLNVAMFGKPTGMVVKVILQVEKHQLFTKQTPSRSKAKANPSLGLSSFKSAMC
jgi:hypothetical protein